MVLTGYSSRVGFLALQKNPLHGQPLENHAVEALGFVQNPAGSTSMRLNVVLYISWKEPPQMSSFSPMIDQNLSQTNTANLKFTQVLLLMHWRVAWPSVRPSWVLTIVENLCAVWAPPQTPLKYSSQCSSKSLSWWAGSLLSLDPLPLSAFGLNSRPIGSHLAASPAVFSPLSWGLDELLLVLPSAYVRSPKVC